MTGRPRTYTTLLALVLVGMFAVAIMTGEQANASGLSYGRINQHPPLDVSKANPHVIVKLDRSANHPSDGNLAAIEQVTYALLERGVDNDKLVHIASKVDEHTIAAMYIGAQMHCGSDVYEDFTCDH